jgi:hypothetical protein
VRQKRRFERSYLKNCGSLGIQRTNDSRRKFQLLIESRTGYKVPPTIPNIAPRVNQYETNLNIPNSNRLPPVEANGMTILFRLTKSRRLPVGKKFFFGLIVSDFGDFNGSAHSLRPQLGSALSSLSLTHIA